MEDSKYISRWKSSKTILKVAFRSDVHKSSPDVKRWEKKRKEVRCGEVREINHTWIC